MESKHTPGPWHVEIYNEGRNMDIQDEGGHGVLTKDNARLIAAAPDLLAALEDVRTQLRAHVKLDVKKHYSLMVADAAAGTAIAKAKGAA